MRRMFVVVALVGCGDAKNDQAFASAAVAAEVNAMEYLNAFRENKATWADRFKGKKIEVVGAVSKVHDDKDGPIVVLLAGKGGTVSAVGMPREDAVRLKPEQMTRLVCRGVDSGLEPSLDKCSVMPWPK